MAEPDDTGGAGAATGRAASRFKRPASAITADPRVDGGVTPRGRGVGRNRNGGRAARDPLGSVPSVGRGDEVGAAAAARATLPPPVAVQTMDAPATSSERTDPAPPVDSNHEGSAREERSAPSGIVPAQAIEWAAGDPAFGGEATLEAGDAVDGGGDPSAERAHAVPAPVSTEALGVPIVRPIPVPVPLAEPGPPPTVDLRDAPSNPVPPAPRSPGHDVLPPAETLATLVAPEPPAALFDQARDAAGAPDPDAPVDDARVTRSLPVIFRTRPRKRVRRVTRVVRHIDTWSVFKVALVFNVVLYIVALTAGVLLWNVAYTTGTVDNIENFFEQFGWSSFEFRGGEIYHNGWVAGLFAIVGFTGVAVLLATLFNLITDLVGGVRVSVLEEEVVARPQHAETTTVRKRPPRSERADRALAPLARLEREIAAADAVASAVPRRSRTARPVGGTAPHTPQTARPEPAAPASVPGPPQPV